MEKTGGATPARAALGLPVLVRAPELCCLALGVVAKMLNECGWCLSEMKDGQQVFLLDGGEWDTIDASIGPVGTHGGSYLCSKKCVREAINEWWPTKRKKRK